MSEEKKEEQPSVVLSFTREAAEMLLEVLEPKSSQFKVSLSNLITNRMEELDNPTQDEEVASDSVEAPAAPEAPVEEAPEAEAPAEEAAPEAAPAE